MSGNIEIPIDLWRDLRKFFEPLIAPCKDCMRGNLHRCWAGNSCPAFQYRAIGKRITEVERKEIEKPNFILVENEIVEILRKEGKPMYPSCIVLHSTKSKANKWTAISRLIHRGIVVETRINDYTRMLSLKESEQKQP